MLECYRAVGGLVFTDMGVSQRIPLPFALNTGCVMLPLFYFFLLFSFCSALFPSVWIKLCNVCGMCERKGGNLAAKRVELIPPQFLFSP